MAFDDPDRIAARQPRVGGQLDVAANRTYLSADKTVRFTVEPRALTDQHSYFEEKAGAAGLESTGPRPTARAMLERRVEGRWTRLWATSLVNEVAPVSALVSKDGAYVVTFDNWHSMGLGDNVVVIYGNNGRLVRSLRLDQILPVEYLEALPRSVSSLHWSGEHRVSPDGRSLLLAVVVPNSEERIAVDRAPIVTVAVTLATGEFVPPSGPTWDRALSRAAEIVRKEREADALRRAAFVAPLIRPASIDEGDWNAYLREAFFRLDSDWREGFPAIAILRARAARDYKASETHLREMFRETDIFGPLMLAAPAEPDHLVTVIERIARELPTGRLKDMRIYLALPLEPATVIAAALGSSGAKLILIDRDGALPQRPERLAAMSATDANEMSGLAAEADAYAIGAAVDRPE